MSNDNTPEDVQINILAPILAWVFPGLGHWAIGHRRRGRFVAIGVLSLYLGGLLIGGLNVIDKENDFWWYCGQVLIGPTTPAINWYHASHRAPLNPEDPTPPGYVRPSFSHVNEVGTLYTTLAGMLNLLAILDVIVRRPQRPAQHRRGEDDAS